MLANVLKSVGIMRKAKLGLAQQKHVWQLSFDSESSEDEATLTAKEKQNHR